MTEPSPPALDVADRAINVAADSMAHDFLAALLAELRQMPDHWLRLNEDKQQATIDRLKDKIRTGTEKAVLMFMQGDFPAVAAELKGVSLGEEIKASLSVRRDALHRHALCDAQGQRVLVIIADASRWTQRMDEIKARGDQLDLWDAEYDPAKDQPAYRRDQDRTLTGQSWADLKKELGVQPKADGETPPGPTNEGEKPEELPEELKADADGVVDSDLPEEKAWALQIYVLRTDLAAVGIAISYGALKARTDEERASAKAWAKAYAEEGDSCKIDKPSWLPEAIQPPPDAGVSE